MLINKDTKIYGSFSMEPGNNGNTFFNEKFQENNINAIYKSFYSNNIKNSVEAVKCLGFSGFAVSAPFKKEVLEFVDEIDEVTKTIGSANTIINNKGILTAYNTDWIGILLYFGCGWFNVRQPIIILGNGGFSKAAQYAFKILDYEYEIITRNNWDEWKKMEGKIIFNTTPVDIYDFEVPKNSIRIDGRPFTKEGKQIAKHQAEEQFKLYMKYA